MNDLRAAAVQFEPMAGDKQVNLHKIAGFVERAKAQAIDLIVFPECCITGYWFLRNLSTDQLQALAEPAFTGLASRQLAELSQHNNMTIGAGLVEAGEDGRLYNTYIVAMPNGDMRRHRKLHAFEHEAISCGSDYT